MKGEWASIYFLPALIEQGILFLYHPKRKIISNFVMFIEQEKPIAPQFAVSHILPVRHIYELSMLKLKEFHVINICFLILILICTFGIICYSKPYYNSTPNWISEPLQYRSTGLGVSDINQDGWNDIIISNGNDMARQNLCVYYNNGDGSFPLIPSWLSDDLDYHGHLSVGDINGDKLPDVAVSVFLGQNGFDEPGCVKVYYNTGTELEPLPSFRSADSMYTFSCVLGDADGDGDLDLSVAGGQPFGDDFKSTNGRIYYNNNFVLDTLPRWKSEEIMCAMDVEFADMDNNGYLDLIFANNFGPNFIYLADNAGNISKTCSWASYDNDYGSNSIAIADFYHDNYLDLAISTNPAHGGSGRYKIYNFKSAPIGQSLPDWTSELSIFGSAIYAEDIDHNGYTDLITGCWHGNIQLFQSDDNGLPKNPAWHSETISVIEAFALADLDCYCNINVADTIIVSSDSISIFYLNRSNIEKIQSIYLNDQALLDGLEFCSVAGKNWISIKPIVKCGDVIIVDYFISYCRDLIITNWDDNIGNYVFYNQSSTGIVYDYPTRYELGISVFPNPFNQKCTFKIKMPVSSNIEIFIYDLNGRFIKKINSFCASNTEFNYLWDGKNSSGNYVTSGIYLYSVKFSDYFLSGKVLLIK